VLAIFADRHVNRVPQSVDSGDVVVMSLDVRRLSRGRVAVELGETVVVVSGHVDLVALRADRHAPGIVQAVHAALTVVQPLDEGQLARGGVAVQGDDGGIEVAHGVDVFAVGGDGQGAGPVQSVDAAHAISQPVDERQPARPRVAAERGDGVIGNTHDVNVRSRRVDPDASGAVDSVHAVLAVLD
jgi:hypothetical protein